MPARRLGKHTLITGVAGAENDQLRPGGEECLEDGRHQIQPLLVGQAGDHADQGDVGICGQPELVLQAVFARAFPGQVICRITRRDERVVRGLPHAIIHTVENAEEISAPVTQYPIESRAKFSRLDLLRVGLADRIQEIGKDQPTLEQVDLSPELEAGHGVHRWRQPGHLELLC